MLKKKTPMAYDHETSDLDSNYSIAGIRLRDENRNKNGVVDFDTLRFSDDYAEYLARADSGGSTYGLLKRHAFAQSSLRVRPTGYLSAAVGDSKRPTVAAVEQTASNCSRQRRSKSLVPPQRPVSGWDSVGAPGGDGSSATVADQKSIIKALCEQTQKQQKKAPTPQVLQLAPSIDYRRHSSAPCFDRRKLSLHPDLNDRSPTTAGSNALTPQACAGSPSGGTWQPSCQCALPSLTGAAGSSDLGAVNGVASPVYRCVNCGQPTAPVSLSTYRRRSFSVTPKGGLVNEGDMVVPCAGALAVDDLMQLSALVAAGGIDLSRRSSYNSTGSGGGGGSGEGSDSPPVYRVLMLGGPGVGKTALTQQFLTSEFMAAQNTSFDDGREITVPVLLDGETSIMEFIDLPYSGDLEIWREYDVDGYIIIYSITDRRSYQKACDVMVSMRCDDGHLADDTPTGTSSNSRPSKPVILVANKSDLERSRMIGKEEGKTLAHDYGCKYIEVSAILNHKVDDLLVGVLKQIRLHHRSKQQHRAQSQRRRGSRSGGDQQQSLADSLRALASSCATDDQPGCLSKATGRHGVLARLFRVGPSRSKKTTSRSCENLLSL